MDILNAHYIVVAGQDPSRFLGWLILGLGIGVSLSFWFFVWLEARRTKKAKTRADHPAGKKIGRVTSVEMRDDGLYANFELDAEHKHLLGTDSLQNISVGGFDVPVVEREEAREAFGPNGTHYPPQVPWDGPEREVIYAKDLNAEQSEAIREILNGEAKNQTAEARERTQRLFAGLLSMAPNEQGEMVAHGNRNFKWGANRKDIAREDVPPVAPHDGEVDRY